VITRRRLSNDAVFDDDARRADILRAVRNNNVDYVEE